MLDARSVACWHVVSVVLGKIPDGDLHFPFFFATIVNGHTTVSIPGRRYSPVGMG